MKLRRIIFSLVFSFLFLNLGAHAHTEKTFRLSVPLDCTILVTDIFTDFLNEKLMQDYKPWDGTIYNLDEINAFDRFFAQPYDSTLNAWSNVTLWLALSTPVIPLVTEVEEWSETCVMFAETYFVSRHLTEFAKVTIQRHRPFMYFDTKTDEKLSDDRKRSFLSGHTSASFAAASFTSYVFCKQNPDSCWRIPVVAASFGIAATTGALRIACGKHFPTDVLAGATIGCISGFGIPLLHLVREKHMDDKVLSSLIVAPDYVGFHWDF